MPVTPQFTLSQTESHVIAVVRLPYIRVTNLEYLIHGYDFSLYCHPYLLKLTFPGEVVDDDNLDTTTGTVTEQSRTQATVPPDDEFTPRIARAQYDPNKDNGTLTVHIPKKSPGEHFPDLDMVTKLMQPKPKFTTPRQPVPKDTTDETDEARKQLEEMHLNHKKAWKDYQRSKKGGPPLIEVLHSEEYGDTGTVSSISSHTGATLSVNNVSVAAETMTSHTTTVQGSSSERIVTSSSALLDHEGEDIKLPTSVQAVCYGFNNQYRGVFSPFGEESAFIVDLPQPDEKLASERRRLREAYEQATFDVERYMLDYVYGKDDSIYLSAMKFKPWWIKLLTEKSQIQQNCTPSEDVWFGGFTESENKILRGLPNKEFLMEPGSEEWKRSLAGLLTIVYAYCYDIRTTEGEHCVESAWNLSKLSPVLSWLDMPTSEDDAIRVCIRRALIFPYMRRFDLALRVAEDTVSIVRLGRRAILRCLLETKQLLEKEEHMYLLNTVFSNDYCVWIQQLSHATVDELAESVASAVSKLDKFSIELPLNECERQAERVVMDQTSPEEAVSLVLTPKGGTPDRASTDTSKSSSSSSGSYSE